MLFIVDRKFIPNGGCMKNILLYLISAFLLTACSSTPKMDGFTYQPIRTKNITIATWRKNVKPFKKLRIYIDGNAYTTGFITKKPKMYNNVAMQLALKDNSDSIAYLGRPCYFIEQDVCKPVVWEEGKYAPEVIEEMKEVIQTWQKKYNLKEIEFVGYDGGAAIALSLATRMRNIKVNKVITIAGILDTKTDALYRDEDILTDSINPANETYLVSNIPQVHYVGGKDKIVPIIFTQNFVKKLPNPVSVQIKRLPNADHDNWAQFKLDY